MDLFTEGQKLTLNFQKGSSLIEMACSVEKIYDDRLELVLPQYFMRYIEFLQTGNELTAKAFSKLGTIDFNTIIITSPLEETFSIELDYNSIRLTPGNEQPYIKAIENLEIITLEKHLKVKTFEISTEYVKFTSDYKFSVEDSIEGSLNLPKSYGTIKFIATITEIDPIYDNEFVATFSTMTEKDRQDLLYYMYMYTKDTN